MNNLFWYRTSVFFAIIAALFTGYGLVATENLRLLDKAHTLPLEAHMITIMLVIFGVAEALLSWLWLQMHKRATFLQNYYRFRASVIEESLKVELAIFGKIYEDLASKDKASLCRAPRVLFYINIHVAK